MFRSPTLLAYAKSPRRLLGSLLVVCLAFFSDTDALKAAGREDSDDNRDALSLVLPVSPEPDNW